MTLLVLDCAKYKSNKQMMETEKDPIWKEEGGGGGSIKEDDVLARLRGSISRPVPAEGSLSSEGLYIQNGSFTLPPFVVALWSHRFYPLVTVQVLPSLYCSIFSLFLIGLDLGKILWLSILLSSDYD